MVLEQLGGLLGSTQGTIGYHLVLLWVVLAAFGMTLTEWRHRRREQPSRLLFALGGLVLVRFVYFGMTLAVVDRPEAGYVLRPPLERAVDTASIAILAWVFVPTLRRNGRLWHLIIGANVLAVAVVCVVFTLLWADVQAINPALSYANHWQALVWSVWQMLLATTAGLVVLRKREQSWQYFAVDMILFLVGRCLQVLIPSQVPHLPLWERAANLLVYPLVAVGVYENAVAGFHNDSDRLQKISDVSLDHVKSLLSLFEATKEMAGTLDLDAVLDSAVRGIARSLDADQCAIAFPEEGNPSQMRLVSIHNPTRQGRGEEVAFPLEYQHAVQQAMRRKKHQIVLESDNVQLKVLFALMGAGDVGPLLVQPLVADRDSIGAIIVGNSRSRRPFDHSDAKLCQSLAEQLVGAIQNARRYRDAQNRIIELSNGLDKRKVQTVQAQEQFDDLRAQIIKLHAENEDLGRREEQAREARNAVEIKLASSRAEVSKLTERLAVVETDLNQAHANVAAQVHWHEDEQARLQSEWQDAMTTAEWARSVLQGLSAGIILTNAEGIIQDTNVAAEILLDRDSQDLENMDLASVSHDERWNRAVEMVRGGQASRLTIKIGVNTVMCEFVALHDTAGPQVDVKGIVCVLQDITAETEQQRVQLDDVATSALELRTPLTTILSYVDLLLSETVGSVSDQQKKFLSRIKDGSEELSQIVDELVRLTGGKERWDSPCPEDVDIKRIIKSVVDGVQDQIEDRSLTMELHLQEDLPSIEVDPDYLRRIVTNLVSNAYLVSPRGSQIQVDAEYSNGTLSRKDLTKLQGQSYVVVSVRDSGGGLSGESLQRIFDRSRPSQTPAGLGESGAGLALVKMLVETHGGRLWVESETGAGTTFSFVLPLRQRSRIEAN